LSAACKAALKSVTNAKQEMKNMIICEHEFEYTGLDPNPNYYFIEIDRYAFIPYPAQQKFKIESHRLSLRKHVDGTYEHYRKFSDGREEIVNKTKNLQEALDFATAEFEKYWSKIDDHDRACDHSRAADMYHDCYQERLAIKKASK
jgi:hypothetical protein